MEQKRSEHGNAYVPWDDEADRLLCRMYDEGKSISLLSDIFERTQGAIRSRLKKSNDFFTFVESNNTEQHGKSNNRKREKRYRETLSVWHRAGTQRRRGERFCPSWCHTGSGGEGYKAGYNLRNECGSHSRGFLMT